MSEFAIWMVALSVFLLFYAYAGYPLLLFLLSAVLRRRPPLNDYRPTVSILIAAYNEEKSITRKLSETVALNYPADKLEIIVASDGSTDGTDARVREFEDPRVRLVRVEGRRGKTRAQNEAILECHGEIVVFSDATAIYHRDSIARLAAHYEDPKVGAVSGRYKYFDADGVSPTGLGSVAFWNYENLIKLMQSRIGTLTGCSGCIYSVRRSCYTPLPDEACSDLVEPLHIVKKGYRVAFEPAALAFEDTTVSTKQEFRMRVRVATRGMRGILSVPELLNPRKRPWVAFQLFSHKVMRWLVPLFLVSLFIGTAVLIRQPLLRIFLGLQLLFYAFAAVSVVIPFHRSWKVLGLPLFFCTLNAAAAVGLIEVLRGHRYATWETVRRETELPQGAIPSTPVESTSIGRDS